MALIFVVRVHLTSTLKTQTSIGSDLAPVSISCLQSSKTSVIQLYILATELNHRLVTVARLFPHIGFLRFCFAGVYLCARAVAACAAPM